MTYYCFIESSILTTPHMEPLAAESEEAAVDEAKILLSQHASGLAAHVFDGEVRIASVRPDVRSAAYSEVRRTPAPAERRGLT